MSFLTKDSFGQFYDQEKPDFYVNRQVLIDASRSNDLTKEQEETLQSVATSNTFATENGVVVSMFRFGSDENGEISLVEIRPLDGRVPPMEA